MLEKNKKYWDKIAHKFAIAWDKNILQTALYNTNLSEKGNMIVILRDDSIAEIIKAHGVAKELFGKGMEPPLVVSREYISNSLDSFPLEFLNIKTDYLNLLVNEDILAELRFEKTYIRLEMERELKSKILLIKMAILDHYGKSKMLKNLIKVSVHSIEPILKGLLFLLDEKIPLNHQDLITKADEVTDFKIDSLLTAVGFTIGKISISKNELSPFFEEFTEQLQVFSNYVEQMKVQ
jgi:hypothetical protein